jgi:acyl-CoA thioester hydrolase
MTQQETATRSAQARDWLLRPGDISFRGVVFPWDCDSMGHLNNRHYLGLFDQAAWHVFLALGYRAAMAACEQIGLADVQQTITYRRELRAGQLVVVRSWLERVGSKSLTAQHEMFDADEEAPVASLTSVTTFFDLRQRKSMPIPPEIRRVAEDWLRSPQLQDQGRAGS